MGSDVIRPKRSTEDLQRASLAVQYEFMTLFACHDLLQAARTSWTSGDREKAISNAFLHSMLLAARGLLGFLYSHKPRDTDIVAEDFFDDADTWTKKRAVPSPEMADGALMGQISRRLAHLTWDRTDSTKPLWGAFQVVWNIGLALQSFLSLVDGARIHGALRTDVDLGMSLLRDVLNQQPELGGRMAPTIDAMRFDDLHYFGGGDAQT